jgi:hypothetical protein
VKVLGWFAAAALTIIAIVFLNCVEPSKADYPLPPANAPIEPRDPVPEPSRKTVMLPVAETAASLNSPETTPEEDIATLDLLISQFRKHQGGNPVGENDEITAALLGKNPKSLGYLSENVAYIDSGGRLIDRWGTPYFFHALSGDRMEIISAGPDLRHHTADDLASE